MEQNKSALYKYTELVSLRKIDAELWNSLDKNLQNNNGYENVSLNKFIKIQKSLNNIMMKMISTSANAASKPLDSVDEVEGVVVTHQTV